MDWFRSHHGAPADHKWRLVAKRAGVPTHIVVALAWTLLDRASQCPRRGAIDGYDAEALADFMDCSAEQVESVVAALHERGILDDRRFAAWDRRQPKREREYPDAAERKAVQRERKKENQTLADGGTSDVQPCPTMSNHVPPRERRESRLDSSLRSESDSCPKPASPVRTRNAYPDDFERFWSAYPTDPNMSKTEAGKAWSRMSENDRNAAIAAVPSFTAHCRKDTTYRPLHAVRFLTQRRFEGFAPRKAEAAAGTQATAPDPIVDMRNGFRFRESTLLQAVLDWKQNQRSWKWAEMYEEPDKPNCRVPDHVLAAAGLTRAEAPP